MERERYEEDTTKSRVSSNATAEYLDDLLNAVKRMADDRQFGFLAYLVEMAANEAARLARATDAQRGS